MPSEIAIMRAELARVCGELESVKALFTSAFDTASAGIESQARIIAHEKQRADSLEAENSSLRKRLGIYTSWNSRPSENKEHEETRAKFQKNAERYEAEKRGEDPDKTVPVKKAGGQLGHEGVSRKGKPSETRYFYGDMCTCCGRTDPSIIRTIRKRVFKGKDRRKKGEVCKMYVIYVGFCMECFVVIEPQTDVVKGSAFKPKVRGKIGTYYAGGTSVRTIQGYMHDIGRTTISTGAISNCTTATADEVDREVLYVPHGTPIRIDDGDLRMYMSPVPPNAPDFVDGDDDDNDNNANTYEKNEALLVRCSTVWTSFMAQPQMARIIEMASMEPYVGADETPYKVKRENAQVLVARTRCTTQLKVVDHKYLHVIENFLNWANGRVIVHDGAPLYSWHDADEQRCDSHINRASEDYAMNGGFESDEYVRHKIMGEIYHDAKETSAKITEMAGGPITSADGLDIVKTKGLTDTVEAEIKRLKDKVDMAANMIDDKFTVTLKNAKDYMFTALRYPGVPLHNNATEQTILHNVITGGRKKGPFPNWKAARNFSVNKTFAATCKKNGISVYDAIIRMSRDRNWDIFTDCVPPPIITKTAAWK